MPLPPTHPEPDWFRNLKPVSPYMPPFFSWGAICSTCPHVRALHGPEGCRAPSHNQFATRGHRCTCTNTISGANYGDPASLRRSETIRGQDIPREKYMGRSG